LHTLSEMIGIESVTLAQPAKEVSIPAGDARGVKTTPDIVRQDLKDLEQTYLTNPVVFNAINKIVQVIMSSGYQLLGNEESVSRIQEFLDNIGKRGGSTEWQSLLELIFKHQCVYGRAFVEIIYNVAGNKVMDLDFIDPKKIDYAKDGSRKIVLDQNWNPVGYVEKIPIMEYLPDLKSDPVPKKVALEPNSVFFAKERIAHFKLYTIGDGFYGIGLIEPIYSTSQRKLHLERALANIYLKTAFPTKYATVGNQFHEFNSEMAERILEELQKASYDSVLVIPDYVKLDLLEPKHPEKLQENLNYFIDEEVTGTGTPKPFALGSGERTNRATLARQEYLFKLGLADIVKRTTTVIEKEIFAKIARLNKLPDVPQIQWGEIALEELDSKTERLVKYVQAGLLQPDPEIEKIIRKQEGLPAKEKKKRAV